MEGNENRDCERVDVCSLARLREYKVNSLCFGPCQGVKKGGS